MINNDNNDFLNDDDNKIDVIETDHHANNLVHIIKEIGYSAMDSDEIFQTILLHFNDINEDIIANMIIMMINTNHNLKYEVDKSLSLAQIFNIAVSLSINKKDELFHPTTQDDISHQKNWNIKVFINIMNKLYQPNWLNIIELLPSYTNFYFPNYKSLLMLFDICQQTKIILPINRYLDINSWNNSSSQLSFLKYIISIPANIFNFNQDISNTYLISCYDFDKKKKKKKKSMVLFKIN